MKIATTLFIQLLLTSVSYSQVFFENNYGGNNGETGNCVKQLDNGGFVIVGTYTQLPYGKTNLYFLLTDSLGNEINSVNFGGTLNDEAYSLDITSDNGFIITGATEVTTDDRAPFLIKTDSAGNIKWIKTYNDPGFGGGVSVKITEEGGYIVSGSQNNGSNELLLFKTDSVGNVEWSKTYRSSGFDASSGRAVELTNNGGFIACGSIFSWTTGYTWIYVVCVDQNGDTTWTGKYKYDNYSDSFDIKKTPDNGFVISGTTSTMFVGHTDLCLLKIDSLGNQKWIKKMTTTDNESATSVLVSDDGGFVMTGWTQSETSGISKGFILKTDSQGALLWTKLLGPTSSTNIISACFTHNSGIAVCGSTNDTLGSLNAYLAEFRNDSLHHIDINNFITNTVTIQCYPNPCATSFSMDTDKKGMVEIFDELGKLVLCSNKTFDIDIRHMPDGVYSLRFVTGNHCYFSRIIKQE